LELLTALTPASVATRKFGVKIRHWSVTLPTYSRLFSIRGSDWDEIISENRNGINCGRRYRSNGYLGPSRAGEAYGLRRCRNQEHIDAEGLKTVAEKAPAITEAAGGHPLVATNAITSLDRKPPQRFVLVAFASVEKAKAWYDMPAMKELTAMRIKSTDSLSFIVEGTK
jgi:uncharacterized protein (DUF1330 family)